MKAIFSFTFIILAWLHCPLLAQDILLTNAQILDPDQQIISETHLWLKDGKVYQQSEQIPADFAGPQIDLSGKYVLPAFVDLHTHSWGNAGVGGQMEMLMTKGSAERMLYCGVTAFLDLFSEENSIFAMRDQQRSEGMLGADIFCAGPILTCDGGHGTEYGIPTRTINNPVEAREVVQALFEERQPDVIKIVYDNAPRRLPSIDLPTLQAAISSAKQHGAKTVIHIGSWQDVIDALKAGASAITHLPGGPMPEEVPALFLQNEAVLIPTLTVENDLLNVAGNPQVLDHPLLAGAVNPLVIDSYRDKKNLDPRTANFMHFQKEIYDYLGSSLQKLYEAGVAIYTGTDGGNPGVFQGYSVHREMVLMQQMGMKEWDILAAASTQAADFLGLSYGVQAGDIANFIVLSANPLVDITHTQQIEAVIQHGQMVDREALAYQESRSTKWQDSLITDFSETNSSWQAMSDQIQGGGSSVEMQIEDQQLKASGKLQPTEKMPYCWVMMSRYLQVDQQPVDISNFTGIKLRYRLPQGSMYISLMDERVSNFDYHAFILEGGEEWQEVEIPFSRLGQNFTRPAMEWKGEKILGIAIGASSPQPMPYAIEVDWIELY
ncbi:MAG: CIA30 family protein [Bacteroidota bacterium]